MARAHCCSATEARAAEARAAEAEARAVEARAAEARATAARAAAAEARAAEARAVARRPHVSSVSPANARAQVSERRGEEGRGGAGSRLAHTFISRRLLSCPLGCLEQAATRTLGCRGQGDSRM